MKKVKKGISILLAFILLVTPIMTSRTKDNKVGFTAKAEELSTTTPEAPSGLQDKATTDTAITLSWIAPDNNSEIAGYEIYRDNNLVGTATDTVYNDTGLASGTTYSYTVKAKDTSGNISAASDALKVTTQLPVPNAVITSSSSNSVSIKWDAIPSADSYQIRIDGNTSYYTNITSYTISYLSPNSIHTLEIRALGVTSNCNSNWSDSLTISTLLLTPKNLSLTSSEIGTTINWDAVDGASQYEIYRNGVKIATTTTNTYVDNQQSNECKYVYTIIALNENENVSDQSNAVATTLNSTETINSNLSLTQDTTYYNLNLTGGTLDLNGYNLTVLGDFDQSGGTVKVNGGKLTIEGNYTDNGILKMTNSSDYVLVNGNYIVQASINSKGNLTAGTLEIKGDFKQDYIPYVGGCYDFIADGTHKVLFSGSRAQNITFSNPSESHFNTLEISSSAYKINFKSAVYLNNLQGYTSNCTNLTLNFLQPLNNDLDINTNLTLVSCNLNLNGHKLAVNGDLTIDQYCTLDLSYGTLDISKCFIQGGIVNADHGNLIIHQNYINNNSLKMTNSSDYVLVDENYFSSSTNSSAGNLTAGILEIKGNFKQSCVAVYGGKDNFAASGTHKVLLSGSKEQNVYFTEPNYSHFNILEIGPSTYKINCKTAIQLNYLQGNTDNFINLNIYILEPLINDLDIKGDLILSKVNLNGHKLSVEGNLNIIQSYCMIDLSGGTLEVTGNLIQDEGTVYIDGGKLIIGGNYINDNVLNMTNPSDYVLVNKNYSVCQDVSSAGKLTAGVLEIKGDFRQGHIPDVGGSYSFVASGTHKVILSGSNIQNINFDDPYYSHFNILEIDNKLNQISTSNLPCEQVTGSFAAYNVLSDGTSYGNENAKNIALGGVK